MNVVDSSGWLEYFADGSNADYFAKTIENISELIVPAISLYEVFKRIMLQRGEGAALEAVAVMMQGQVVDLDSTLALALPKSQPNYKSRWQIVLCSRPRAFMNPSFGHRMQILKV